jgi:hypothetical protein
MVTAESILPSQVMSLVQTFVSTLDNFVNYKEFLRIVSKASNFGQDEEGPHFNSRGLQLNGQERETVDRLRRTV